MGRTSQLGLIALGGGIGALIRHGVGELLPTATFPWATFVVNIIGTALLAFATAPTRTKTHKLTFGTGFCGGLTTFSTFSVEVASLADSGQNFLAVTYMLASLATGLAAFVAVRSVVSPGPEAPTSPTGRRPT